MYSRLLKLLSQRLSYISFSPAKRLILGPGPSPSSSSIGAVTTATIRGRKTASAGVHCQGKMTRQEDDLDEILSDESSFYGDEDQKAALEDLVAAYDPLPYWNKTHPHLLSTIQYRSFHAASAAAKRKDKKAHGTEEGDSDSSTKSVPEFLANLPPSKAKASIVGPWLVVQSTHHTDPIVSGIGLVSAGTKLLREFEDAKATLKVEHERSHAKTEEELMRKLNPLQQKLESDLFATARKTGIITGKWMLFPSVDHVDRVWRVVAKATRKGKLGVAAKVATDDGSAGRARLVAVYTRDFDDKEDIKRVLQKLVALGVVERRGTPIYYKCDAYSYLEIKSDNEYGLRASMFSSRDVWKGKV
ncbi:hypothetical protein VTN02DRAFT_2458 [Thermoascus thermophilus]